MFKKTFVASVIGLGVAVSGSAQALNIDFNGNEAGGGASAVIFDWAPSNGLMVNINPTAPLICGAPFCPSTEFGLYAQGHLLDIYGNNDGPDNWQPAGDGWGWSYEMYVPATAQIFSGANLDVVEYVTGGTAVEAPIADSYFRIYYDSPTVSAAADLVGDPTLPFDDILGTGYNDGILILEADVFSGALGSVTAERAVLPSLDNFDSDGSDLNDDGGITTIQFGGNITVDLDVFFQDEDFFVTYDPITMMGGAEDPLNDDDLVHRIDTATPFEAANPSDVVAGLTPNYGGDGINDLSCSTSSPCDIHIEADGRTTGLPETVPEPASLALLGLGLAGIGFSRRRNQKG